MSLISGSHKLGEQKILTFDILKFRALTPRNRGVTCLF